MGRFFSFFHNKQLKPEWEFNAGTLIWRILLAPANRIIGETRNQAEKTTHFFCLDAHSGKSLWKDFEFDEPWWIGIESIHDRWMILHGFARPDRPEHCGIRIVEIESGKLLWRNDALTFWFAQNNRLYAFANMFEKRLGYELDIETGTILNEHDGNLAALYEMRQNALKHENTFQNTIIFPEVYEAGQRESSIESIIENIIDAKALKDWTEYISHRGILLVSYYQREFGSGSSSLNNILTVSDMKSGELIYREVIGSDVQAPGPGQFFVQDDYAYFLKNQNIMKALRPWK